MIKAICADLDGLLINSEELYFKANVQYFKILGFTFTAQLQRETTGQKFDIWAKKIHGFQTNKSGSQMLQERDAIFLNLLKTNLALLPGALEFVTMAHLHFKTALVTSAAPSTVEAIFKHINIREFFDVIITGNLVVKGKPNPECYLLAAERLGVKPVECVIFEDAPNGVLAGKKAGMKVIAIPSQFVQGDKQFKLADTAEDSL